MKLGLVTSSRVNTPYDTDRAVRSIIEAFGELGDESGLYVVVYGDKSGTSFLLGPSLGELFRELVRECVKRGEAVNFVFGVNIPGLGVGGAIGVLDVSNDAGMFTSVWGSTPMITDFMEALIAGESRGGEGIKGIPRIQA